MGKCYKVCGVGSWELWGLARHQVTCGRRDLVNLRSEEPMGTQGSNPLPVPLLRGPAGLGVEGVAVGCDV